ncbi:MAG: hypothetical protein HC793_00015 [Aquincola sp.]|nr:hypothetical protein [Aquincola sp.]
MERGKVVQRTVTLDGKFFLTAQQQDEDDIWVVGWRPREGVRWRDVMRQAYERELTRHPQNVQVLAHYPGESTFHLLDADALESEGEAQAMSRSGVQSWFGNEWGDPLSSRMRPDVVVVDSGAAKLEVLLETGSNRVAAISVKAPADGMRHYSSFVAAFHEAKEDTSDRAWLATVLEKVCKNNYLGEQTGASGSQTMWRDHHASM